MSTYSPRLVQAFPAVSASGRTFKVYGIFADPDAQPAFPQPGWLRQHVASLRQEPIEQDDHAVGFLMLHFAKDGDYLLMSQWYGVNMLKHWVYRAQDDANGGPAFVALTQRDVIACVWELEVMKFERDAWVRTVMHRGALDEVSTDAYLSATFSGWV
jgi:hypothetical protein